MQSILLAIVRILFKKKHYPLLNLQHKGNLLHLEKYEDSAEKLFYGGEKAVREVKNYTYYQLKTALDKIEATESSADESFRILL